MKSDFRSLVVWVALSLIGLCLSMAAILTVPVHADPDILYAAPTAQGSGDCLSWANACSLQNALSIADSGDEIWVKKGVHKPTSDSSDRTASFTLKDGVAVYGGFAGTETDRGQRNWQTHVTILSGDIDSNDTTENGVVITSSNILGNNSYHVISHTGIISTAVLDGFVVTAGQANGSEWPYSSGGGMLNSFSSPTLRNIIFSGNTATEHGGGMFNTQSHPTLINVTFSGNTASNGGGMYNDRSSPTLNRVTFRENTAGQDGGGLHNYLYSSPTLRNAIFSGNTASNGGGMYSNNKSNPTLVNVTFGGNTADNGVGMYNVQSSPVLTNVIMWDDSPEISNASDANPTIAYSDIRGCGGSDNWNTDCGSNAGNNIDADPLFADLVNGDLHLGVGSLCIDTGNNVAVPPDVTTDLDGDPRIADGDEDGIPVVDMGAYEVQPPPPIPTTTPTTVPTTVSTSPHIYLPVVRK
ncbi:MAG: hypothetical protein ACUVSB_08465 [Anaerolineae bacterium]